MKKRDSDKNPFEKKNLVKLAPEDFKIAAKASYADVIRKVEKQRIVLAIPALTM